MHQADQVIAHGGFAAGKGQLRNARRAAFLDNSQPLVGIQLFHRAKGLVGGVTVQAFLVAVPGTVLFHGAYHQVHTVGGCHIAGVSAQVHRLHMHGRFLPGGQRAEGGQHGIQIRADLVGSRFRVNSSGGFHSLGGNAGPLVLGDLLTLKRLQGVHQPCQQNGPGNAERQNILPVQKCNKRHIAPCFFAREQMNAQHTGALRVQGDMAHNA